VVAVICTCDTRVDMVVFNGLEVGQGVRECAYPFVCGERGKGHVYGYQFRPHDCAGLFYPRSIYVDSSIG
jgi:hypothetical protein